MRSTDTTTVHVIPVLFALAVSLTACGGLKDDDAGEPVANSDDQTMTYDADDFDGDGIPDDGGYRDQVLAVNRDMVKDEATGAYLAPMICVHDSTVLWDDDACLAGWFAGTNDGWGESTDFECVLDADWWIINGEHYVCSGVTDNGDTWRVNFKNDGLSYCMDVNDPDYGSFACWADLTGNARIDPLTTRNEDGTYALSFTVIDGVVYEGFDDGSGEE